MGAILRALAVVSLGVTLPTSPPVYADSAQSGFEARCTAPPGRALRWDTDLQNKSKEEWNDEETFPGDFDVFVYARGAAEMLLARSGRRVPVYARGSALLAVDITATDVAVSGWVYAFDLKGLRAVAAQANAFDFLGYGIKGRVVPLRCEFSLR